MTDAGPDQILSLAQPTSAEWEFSTTTDISYSAANAAAKIFSYTIVAQLDSASIAGDFSKDEVWRAETDAGVAIAVQGTVKAYDPVTRKIELDINYSLSSDVLEVGDTICVWTTASGGTKTGDQAKIESVERQLSVVTGASNVAFAANYTLADDNATGSPVTPNVSIASFVLHTMIYTSVVVRNGQTSQQDLQLLRGFQIVVVTTTKCTYLY
ncbi:MAG: hypothetical protein CM15mV13_2610 [uncultured marine virus]|nr:MAG: hypothetical protein CM15mV13_2610 [uncultured marine virus]